MNYEYCNANPRPSTICRGCAVWIGEVFPPELLLPLPAHPGCWCYYWPTRRPATVTLDDWDRFDESVLLHWIRLAAWMLRVGIALPRMLERLRAWAEDYNRRREERRGRKAPPKGG